MKDFIKALKSGTTKEANEQLEEYKESRTHPERDEERDDIGGGSALANIRILAIYIQRTSVRQTRWESIFDTYFPNSPKKLIEIDVETRWNSTFRMLQDALNAKEVLNHFVFHDTSFKPLALNDWNELVYLEKILGKFEAYTLMVSEDSPRLSNIVYIYYELDDLLHQIEDRSHVFSDIPLYIAQAVKESIAKYNKCYDLMGANLTYYLSMVAQPAIKRRILDEDLDSESAQMIMDTISTYLHSHYGGNRRKITSPPPNPPVAEKEPTDKRRRIFGQRRILDRLKTAGKLKEPKQLDIDLYLAEPSIDGEHEQLIEDAQWALNWWRVNAHQYPCMAEVARDYLAVPCSKVSVERSFNTERDILGVRRHRLSGENLRDPMYLKSQMHAQ
ncbi:hypothetical protein N7495_003444 [Penicillium taxi]|uniref:uncharacterized protein n=1 Tax=Penicillium taxi TaxID=168475 RepID=UPI0025459688|nr:uncharacterized protein N7495_003444 [Penicillium taxi]KAJ5902916.1 hypothetical protein N7495_003444 [Penicillium taxi]